MQLTRVPGIASVTIFGAGQYAMRLWVNPDVLARRSTSPSPEIIKRVADGRTRSIRPARSASEPVPPGQDRSPTPCAPRAYLKSSEQQFGDIVLRANPDGSRRARQATSRGSSSARSTTMIVGRFKGNPAAIIARSTSFPARMRWQCADGAKKLMAEARAKQLSARDGLRHRARHHAGRQRGHARNRSRRWSRR